MTTLTVGAGGQFATLAKAVAAADDGDTIQLKAGTYTNDFTTIAKDLTIEGVGGVAKLVATVAPPNGKAIMVTRADVTIRNLEFTGAKVADDNGAGIRYEQGDLTIENSFFHHNQNGLLANKSAGGSIAIRNSEFSHNGAGDGQSHNLYVGSIDSLRIEDSYFHDARVGHQIKSRAINNVIVDNRIYDGAGTGSYSIDLPNGGRALIEDNVIHQGDDGRNPAIVAYGTEGDARAGSSLTLIDNVVVNDLASVSTRFLMNRSTVTAQIEDNDLFGLSAAQVKSGPAAVLDTSFLSTRPTLDAASTWDDAPASDPVPPQPPAPPVPTGTNGRDRLVGTAESDVLSGLDGNDILYGKAGADRLEGGAGEDLLRGGANADTLVGGADADRFDWDAAWEAGKGPGARDIVLDFLRGTDKIDLAGIDARTDVAGNNAFTFIGQEAFHGIEGELRFFHVEGSNDYTVVQGDLDGDRVADFEVQFDQLVPLTVSDFVL